MVSRLAVDLLKACAQLPFQVRIDDRQRLVEQDRRDVAAHQASLAPSEIFCLASAASPAATVAELAAHVQSISAISTDARV